MSSHWAPAPLLCRRASPLTPPHAAGRRGGTTTIPRHPCVQGRQTCNHVGSAVPPRVRLLRAPPTRGGAGGGAPAAWQWGGSKNRDLVQGEYRRLCFLLLAFLHGWPWGHVVAAKQKNGGWLAIPKPYTRRCSWPHVLCLALDARQMSLSPFLLDTHPDHGENTWEHGQRADRVPFFSRPVWVRQQGIFFP